MSNSLRKYLLYLFALCFFQGLCAQDKKKEKMKDSISRDSTYLQKDMKQMEKSKDTSDVYKDIKKYSERSKVGKQLHEWIFREPDKDAGKAEINPQDTINYTPYEGKVIRHTEIKTMDPFGYSINDEDKYPHSWFEKVGNALHAKSKNMAIKKYFLFDKGQEMDTFLIRETARLLRQQGYVRKVKIEPVDSAGVDSLDLEVKVLDSWSMLPRVRISGSHTKAGIHERNFLGMGHEADIHYSKRYSDGNTGFEAAYKVPNIKNSFVDAVAKYRIDLDHFYDRYVHIDRKFYSSRTRWAGGAFYQERFLERPIPNEEMEFEDRTFKYRYEDFWGAYAIPAYQQKDDPESMTNIILALRGSFLDYKRKLPEEFDPTNYFSNEQFYLGSIGLSSRRFVEDAFIFKDGQIEDVPIGSYYALTSGVKRKNHQTLPYFGLKATFGTYFNWGFLSTNLEAGTYYRGGRAQEGTISFKANYFSNIWNLGARWRMRQFIKPQVMIGLNRLATPYDRLSLNDEPYFSGVNSAEYVDYDDQRRYIDYKNGSIEGFDSYVLGTRKFVLDFHSQFYAPWDLWGFHINPYFNLSLAYIGGKEQAYESNKFYSSVGVGVIIRNDYLVFDSFQLSLNFYPRMPGEGNAIIRTNAYRTEDFGFEDFQPSEPQPVIYE